MPAIPRIFILAMTFFATWTASGAIYRLPLANNEQELTRPAPGLRAYPRTYRLLNYLQQHVFAAVAAIEFEERQGKLYRQRTYKIDMVKEAASNLLNSSCMNELQSGAFPDGVLFTAAMSAQSLRISTQALKEMRARNYMSASEAAEWGQEGKQSLDAQIFFESLSWVPAADALRFWWLNPMGSDCRSGSARGTLVTKNSRVGQSRRCASETPGETGDDAVVDRKTYVRERCTFSTTPPLPRRSWEKSAQV